MAEMTEIQGLILQLAQHPIVSSALRDEIQIAHPELTEGAFLSAALGLQNARLLVAEEIMGAWAYTTVQPGDIKEPEYSAEFAEKIIAADCGEWTEIDPDTLIAELEVMIKRAKGRDAGKGKG